MSFPSGWQTATGAGHLSFDSFQVIGAILLYIPNDTINRPFFGGSDPFQIYRPGIVGFGLDPTVGEGIDPLPDGSLPTIEVWATHLLKWQYEAWQIQALTINSGSCFFWQMNGTLTLNYQILGPS